MNSSTASCRRGKERLRSFACTLASSNKIAARPGAVGAFGANHHLRQSLVFLNVPTMQQPEAYLSHVDKLLDEHGKLVSDGTGKFLQGFMQAFANWVETVGSQGKRV